jgi:hypothetical protein
VLQRGHDDWVLWRGRGQAELQCMALRLQCGHGWAEERARRCPRPSEMLAISFLYKARHVPPSNT